MSYRTVRVPEAEQSLEDRYEGYPHALQTVAAFRELWTAMDAAAPANEEETATLDRWSARVERAFRSLEIVDPVLLDGPLARQLTAAANAATAELATGISAPNAEPQMDALHELIGRLAGLAPGGPEARPLSHITDDAASLVSNLRSQIAELQQAVTTLEGERDRLVAAFDEQIQVSTSSTTELVERLEADVERALTSAREQVKGDQEAFARAAEEHDSEAENLLVAIRQKLGMAADESLSAGYDKSADREEKSADRLRIGAIVAGAVSAVIAIAAVVLAGQGGDWSGMDLVPVKLAAVAAPAAIATYLAKQSNGHRTEAWRLRQVRLELANLGEYLSELDPTQRQEIRRLLVARYFATEPYEHDDSDGYRPFTARLLDQLGARTSATDEGTAA